jgi:hypothetical protein
VDDALSVRELPNGSFEIGVHIADVSHFVQQVCQCAFPSCRISIAGHAEHTHLAKILIACTMCEH